MLISIWTNWKKTVLTVSLRNLSQTVVQLNARLNDVLTCFRYHSLI